ncbi:unnamed protein product [Lactuca virosa]|uniref:Kinesin motor domain-containing protein n=1 Tax=Lactuca virosa TaxID=75947 RepID=A0AAU9PR45_9ASTR|nr:unnamed protein product [Lactuca virosa]
MNRKSCLTLHVQGRDLTSVAVLRGCMHLVYLAGSERVDKYEVAGDSSLAQKNAHVPYRNSKLTQLLQDSLVATVELGVAQLQKDSSSDVKDLKEPIANLKAALAKKEGDLETDVVPSFEKE